LLHFLFCISARGFFYLFSGSLSVPSCRFRSLVFLQELVIVNRLKLFIRYKICRIT
jgi:hypothetical protein